MNQHAQTLLQNLLAQSGGARERGYLLVLDGEGLSDLPETLATPHGTYHVHRASTEIGLRHQLWKTKDTPQIIVLEPRAADRVKSAPDLLRRAHNRRIHALATGEVLETLLGVRLPSNCHEDLERLALEHVDRLREELGHRTIPTVLDSRLLTNLLLDIVLQERVQGVAPGELLARWVRNPPAWEPRVYSLVRDHLTKQRDDAGALLAWALEDPKPRLDALVVYGAVLTVGSDELPETAWGPFDAALKSNQLVVQRQRLRELLPELARDALRILEAAGDHLLAAAERVGRTVLTPRQLEYSSVLPLAFLNRCQRLAKEAAAGEPIPEADLKWLDQHHAAGRHASYLRVIKDMARVQRALLQPDTLGGTVLEQVRDYQRNSAFLDLAIQRLQRSVAQNSDYLPQVHQLVDRARQRRDAQNERFAHTLARGYSQALHTPDVTPLHRVWRNVVCPRWVRDPKMRLLFVVLDGCSYSLFLELLQELTENRELRLGLALTEDAGLPALSPLPTITSHARAALFLGELPKDPLVAETVFRDSREASTDPARFNQNEALGPRTRRLYLKGNLTDGAQALIADVRDTQLDVVAVVFNAIDDQIGSSNTGASLPIRLENIHGLLGTLKAAKDSGRQILLTADHGHSPFQGNGRRVGNGNTPRYVELQDGHAVPDGFLEIDVEGLGGPPARRAFAWRTGAYLGSQQAGFHGGAGLEEMVVPLAWLVPEGQAALEPAWWHPARAPVASATATAASATAATPARSGTRRFTPVEYTPAPVAPVAPPQLTLFAALDASDFPDLPAPLVAILSTDERRALKLLQEVGTLRLSELAARLDKPAGRASGLMVALRRKLTEHLGQPLFVQETLPDQQTQYRYQSPAGI